MAAMTQRTQLTPQFDDSNPQTLGRKWFVLWTRSQHEQLVFEQLSENGFQLFLPTLDVWVRRHGTRHRATVPMFPGYLFLNHVMDKTSYIRINEARGLVRILGDTLGRPGGGAQRGNLDDSTHPSNWSVRSGPPLSARGRASSNRQGVA